MKDKEKMLLGELYYANCEELVQERNYVKDLCYEYNNLKPSQENERRETIKKILGSTEENFLIEQPFICDYGYNIKIGKGSKLEIKKIFVAIAGPIINLLITLIIVHIPIEIFTKLMIIYANILIMIFNLLPIYPLDGGRIIKSILHILYGKKASERYINNISFITLIAITFISSIIIYVAQNIAIFIIIIVLWIMYIMEDIRYKRKLEIYKLLEKSIENN